MAYGLLCLYSVALALSGCASGASSRQIGRVVQSEYRDWTITITPYSSQSSGAPWRANVDISPVGRTPETQRRIRLHYTETAPSEQAIVAAALKHAQRHIDGLRLPAQ
jgi:hypothetical protein